MRIWMAGSVCWLVFVCLSAHAPGQQSPNLVEDPSFEMPKERDQFGLVFAKWGGWKYEGDCGFAAGEVARTGKHSCLLVGGTGAKIRTVQLRDLEPGRYQITAYLRERGVAKTGDRYAVRPTRPAGVPGRGAVRVNNWSKAILFGTGFAHLTAPRARGVALFS